MAVAATPYTADSSFQHVFTQQMHACVCVCSCWLHSVCLNIDIGSLLLTAIQLAASGCGVYAHSGWEAILLRFIPHWISMNGLVQLCGIACVDSHIVPGLCKFK